MQALAIAREGTTDEASPDLDPAHKLHVLEGLQRMLRGGEEHALAARSDGDQQEKSTSSSPTVISSTQPLGQQLRDAAQAPAPQAQQRPSSGLRSASAAGCRGANAHADQCQSRGSLHLDSCFWRKVEMLLDTQSGLCTTDRVMAGWLADCLA